jgi:hypothetical protein
MSWTPAPSNALCGLSFKAAPIVSARPKDVTCAACLNRLARAGIRLDPRAAAGPSPRDSKGRDANGVARGAVVDGAAFGAHVAVRINRVRSGRAPQPGDPLFASPASAGTDSPHAGDRPHRTEDAQAPSERESRGTARACSIAAGLVLGIALLSGCGEVASDQAKQPSRGEFCVRYCHPLPLKAIGDWGFCVCGEGPVCADGSRP